ncbi:hypothetical protein, partial [Desertihabitans brevis]|uniref:hypothetical protein n=1 Tax=Desertihabitans brevis TaxID=2268447 RepID=UPI001314B2A0
MVVVGRAAPGGVEADLARPRGADGQARTGLVRAGRALLVGVVVGEEGEGLEGSAEEAEGAG